MPQHIRCPIQILRIRHDLGYEHTVRGLHAIDHLSKRLRKGIDQVLHGLVAPICSRHIARHIQLTGGSVTYQKRKSILLVQDGQCAFLRLRRFEGWIDVILFYT